MNNPIKFTTEEKPKAQFLHVNKAYIFASLAFMALGFALMAIDSEPYGFGSLGLTVGPLMLVISFVLPILALFSKPKVQA